MSPKLPTLNPGQPLIIEWDDAGTPHDQPWLTPDEIKDQHHITSLGYFMKQTKRYFTIAQTISTARDGTTEYCNAFSIPRGSLRKITKL